MSIHPSLSQSKGRRHRNVLKRFERVQYLQDKGTWQPGLSVFGLPKVKSIKLKVKKAPKEAEAAAGTATEAATAATPAASKAPAGKAAPAKGGDKEKGKG